MEKIMISGFSDEISSDFDEQLKVVTGLGMEYISLRTADGKSIADYTAKEVKEKLLPKLKDAGVRVSSLGSPIGKVEIGDEEGFAKQLVQLEELCRIAKVLDCRYIRIFSFYIPEGRNPEDYRDAVIQAASNALTAAQNTLDEGEKIVQILSLTVYLNATEDYTTHAKVGDIVSGWLYEQLGDAGVGARAAIGLATLPGNAPVEVQLVAAAE